MKASAWKFLQLVFFSFLTSSLTAQSAQQVQRMNVAILLFDDVQIIDYTGPYEVLASRFNVFTVAERRDTIHTIFEMKVIPDYDFSQHPAVDILVVPGGGGARTKNPGPFEHFLPATETPALMDWVKKTAASSKYVLSVCNGAFILARAGLLDNLSATCTAPMIGNLQKVSASIKPVYDKRFVDNGKIITSGGLSSGIDASLHIIEKVYGRGAAQLRALILEYPWDPEGNWSRSALADKYMMFRYDGLNNVKSLSRQGDQAKWENAWSVSVSKPEEVKTVMDIVNKTLENNVTYGGVKTTWKRTGEGPAKSEWAFVDEKGRAWLGVAEMTTTAENLIYELRVGIHLK